MVIVVVLVKFMPAEDEEEEDEDIEDEHDRLLVAVIMDRGILPGMMTKNYSPPSPSLSLL